MRMLSNRRHEAFAHGLAAGKFKDAAYVEAGYSRNSSNAARLSGDERIIARVGELKQLVADMKIRSTSGVVLTQAWVIEQLIGVVVDAKAQPKLDTAGANKALHL